MQFASLKLSDSLLRALVDQGYETPTPIQAEGIPPILEGRDVLGCAQTGTGKTAAFALPILDRLMNQPRNLQHRGPAIPRALILSPTRELACQIGDSFATYGRHTGLRHTVVYGGVKQIHQERALRKGVDVLVATPGRLIDLGEQGILDLSAVNCFVLDEADRMLDMGFIDPIRRIASHLHDKRQTLLFSATMPREIKRLANSLLTDPIHIAVTPVASTAPLIDQTLFMVARPRKLALLRHIIEHDEAERTLVFTRTKHGAEKVCKQLNRIGIDSNSIHGNKTQNQRQRALDSFKRGYTKVLVATDVAARGLDVDDISHVFNFDLPMDPEAYVHRIGRTGRAGATGIAISFCDPAERSLLREIEKLLGKQLDTIKKLPQMEDIAPMPRSSDNGEKDYREHGYRDKRDYREKRESRDHHRSGSRSGKSGGRSSDRYAERDSRGSSSRHDRSGDKSGAPAPAKKKFGKRKFSNADRPADTRSTGNGGSGFSRKKSRSAGGYGNGGGDDSRGESRNGSGGAGFGGGNKSGKGKAARGGKSFGGPKANRSPKATGGGKASGGAQRTAKRKTHRKGPKPGAKPGGGVRSSSPRG